MQERLKQIQENIQEVDTKAMQECKAILDARFKPHESLGVAEAFCVQMAGITGKALNSLEKPCHFIASADNGIIEENVSSCPLEFTRLVSQTMLESYAAIGIFCKNLNIPLNLIDIGIKGDLAPEFQAYSNFYNKKVAYGTKNFAKEPAMSMEECLQALYVGFDMIQEKAEYDCFSNGEMGIGNTSTSSAILYALTRDTQAGINSIVGRGGGLSDEGLKRKKALVLDAYAKYDLDQKSPLEILQYVGGFDIACMVGMYLGAAHARKPMLVDGFISAVAALTAVAIEPKVRGYIVGTHKSEEPGMQIVLEKLKLKTFLDMNMRLGEGTGAVLAYPILRAALEIPQKMSTSDAVYAKYEGR